VSDDRRQHERIEIWFPVRMVVGSSTEALGVAHDASRAAVRVSAARQLTPGERVQVTLSLVPATDDGAMQERVVDGTILRLEPNSDDPEGLWPYRITICFDQPIPELEPLLLEGAERLKNA
jgi:hypothetical protein